ncbi:MAG TPA: hypothetical protein VK745_05770 [Polyangiaceae bacterium]|nr:hypothetical protein [Polyangiaceae bacterium]
MAASAAREGSARLAALAVPLRSALELARLTDSDAEGCAAARRNA